MHRWAVEALAEILGKELPVRLYVRHDALADAQVAQPVGLELPVQLTDIERAAAGEIDEHEAAPPGRRHAMEREILHAEVGRLHAPRRRHELPPKVVGPRVVRADDAPAREVAALLGTED